MTTTRRIRSALACLVAILIAVAVHAAPATQPATRSLVCLNLPEVSDWGAPLLVNVLQQSRPLGSFDVPWDEAVGKVNPRHYPSAAFGFRIASESVKDFAGAYDFSCAGECTAIEGCEVFALHYDPAANRTTAEMFVVPRTTSLTIRITGKNVTDARMIPRGEDASAGFRAEVFVAADEFGGFRGMDLSQTRKTPLVEWADRATLADPCFGSSGNPAGETSNGCVGVPYEILMRACKRTGKAYYANVPYYASDDFVRKYAALCLAELGPDYPNDVEFDNENWNDAPGFPHGRDNEEKAAAWAAARPDVRAWLKTQNGGTDDLNGWRWCRYADNVVRVSRIFKASGFHARMTYGCQIGWLAGAEIGLGYIEKFYGPATDYVQTVAGAPYFGASPWTDRPGFKFDDLFGPYKYTGDDGTGRQVEYSGANYLDDRLAASAKTMAAFVDFARRHKLIPIAYEAGFELPGDDPRLYDYVFRHIKTWMELGGERMYLYALTGTRGFPWALTDDLTKLSGARYRAARDAARLYRETSIPPPVSPLVTPPPPADPVISSYRLDIRASGKVESTKIP